MKSFKDILLEEYGFKVIKAKIEMSGKDTDEEDYFVNYNGKKYWVYDPATIQRSDLNKKQAVELDLKKKIFRIT